MSAVKSDVKMTSSIMVWCTEAIEEAPSRIEENSPISEH